MAEEVDFGFGDWFMEEEEEKQKIEAEKLQKGSAVKTEKKSQRAQSV